MTILNDIVSDGFSISESGGVLTGLALLSLRTGLKAYFSTYRTMAYNLHMFDPKYKSSYTQKQIDLNHFHDYYEACSEALLHFQHFAELVCKEFLREKHELLTIDASNRPTIMYKLLNGQSVNPIDLEGLKTLEFSQALTRLYTLIKSGEIADPKLKFIINFKETLDALNTLRNRLWHRGTFILRYPALDNFIGQYVMPFIHNVLALNTYKGQERIWKYKILKCNIDPIEGIIKEYVNGEYNIGKIAFLKELGRAAFENPLGSIKFFDREVINRAERVARLEINDHKADHIRDCPVCGVHSLIVYKEIETDDINPEDGTAGKAWIFTSQVKCACCSFEINHHLDNPSKYGFSTIEDYWEDEEL